jgi:thioredoxin-dependent peroxiredoxin
MRRGMRKKAGPCTSVQFRFSAVRRGLVAVLAAAVILLPRPALAEMLAAGAAMPEFALPDQDGNVVKSSELSGKTYLLWFYPMAMTPGCTTEARGLRDEFKDLEAAGITVLGVSFDSPESNHRFVAAESLPFRLLSDKERKLAVAVGAADSEKTWFASRISYLVGPDGKVVKAYDHVDPDTHAKQVLADVTPAGPR